MNVLDHPYVIGVFVWTAFDYVGEASIGWRGYWQEQSFYPWNLAYCGDIDTCGWKRPQSYYRDALWKENQLSIFVKPPKPSFPENPNRQSWSKWHWHDVVANWNWTGHENESLQVSVYSSCDEVELFLNGKSLGKKVTSRATEFTAVWTVPYQAGTLQAKGYSNGRPVNTAELKTAGIPVRLKLSADRTSLDANNQDLSYITVELLDAKGVRNPVAENAIAFSLEGDGQILAVANTNPMSTESYQQGQRKAWQGRSLIIVKGGKQAGQILLTAKSKGLIPATLVIKTR
jgi:beta-galactosidase